MQKLASYSEQVSAHIDHLRAHGLDVAELDSSGRWIRCHPIGKTTGRGELTYRTHRNPMDHGRIGLVTVGRGPNGPIPQLSTYSPPNGPHSTPDHPAFPLSQSCSPTTTNTDTSAEAQALWDKSSSSGFSPYLKAKGVLAHGLRFRHTTKFGWAAVVPMRDERGSLQRVQFLNADGGKVVQPKNPPGCGMPDGLFHMLKEPIPGLPILIAEGYATSATCYELTGLPTICAFGAANLLAVAEICAKKHPDYSIVICADDQRSGRAAADNVCKALGDRATLALPDFGAQGPAKGRDDWNDLATLIGREAAKAQLMTKISLPALAK